MKIGELATRAGCLVQTIRFYEAEGLLQAPLRGANNYREYGEEQATRLAFILRCRSLDMAHDEIRVLLRLQDQPGSPCDEVNALLDEHIKHVVARISELKVLRRQLQDIRNACAGGHCIQDCGALESLHQTSVDPPSKRGHVQGPHR